MITKESIEEIGFGGLRLIQSEEGFRFGIDAVLLADFAGRLYPAAQQVVDLGTGNGAVSFILSHKLKSCTITGIDIQAKAVEMATRSCVLNSLEDRIRFLQCDVARLRDEIPQLHETADMVVSNPPYVAKGAGIINAEDSKFISRQETTAGIEEFVAAASFILRNRGHFFMIHRPSRLVDLFYYCRKYSLEPKDIRLVCPHSGVRPNIVMVHSTKGGGRELNVCNDLYVYDDMGNFTSEIMKIYEKTG